MTWAPRRRSPAPLPPLAAIVLLGGVALMGPLLAPLDPRLSTGMPLMPPSPLHPLGTNDIGQDLLSEWLWGARTSVGVAMEVALLSTLLSWGVGLAAGLWRHLEGVLLAGTDLLLAVPSLPLALLTLTLLGPSHASVVLVLVALSWAAFARVVHAQVLGLRGALHVEAARALGATELRIALHHVLPSTLALLPAKLVLTVRYALFAEATLAFLGLGDPGARSWGGMLGWAFNYAPLFLTTAWTWWVLPPAAGIATALLATSWLGGRLADTPAIKHGDQPG